MGYYVGLDVSLKATRICVVDENGRAVWEGVADTHSEMIANRLARFSGALVLVGLETGSITPWLYRSLKGLGLPVVCMDARRAAEAQNGHVREPAPLLALVDPKSLQALAHRFRQPRCAPVLVVRGMVVMGGVEIKN